MKHQWLAYVIVAILAVGAGVAIAGLPNDVPVDATIVVPATTDEPEPTLAITTTTTAPPETTVAPTTAPTTAAPSTTPSTTEVPPTTTIANPLPDRSEISAATANGAGTQGAAARAAEQLEGLGYVGIQRFDGTDIAEFTIIYYINGFEEAAARMAADLDLLPQFIAPIAEAPVVPGLVEVELLAYVGVDRG